MVIKMRKLLAIIIIFSLFLVACKETKTIEPPVTTPPPAIPVPPEPPAAEVTPDTPLTEDVEEGIDGIDTLDTDLDISDLEDIDKELDSIDW